MKAAAGCFGCLTLIFLAMLAGGFAVPYLAAGSDASGPMYMLLSYAGLMQTIGGSCCCLSSLAFVIFLALGMRGGNSEIE